jgi:hypothetical protein
MGIGRLFQCLLANLVRLRQVLILALDFSSGPLTNFKGAFHKIPCGHSPLKVMIMSQKWLPQRSERSLPKNCPTRNGGLRKLVITLTALLPRNLDQVRPGPSNCAGHTALGGGVLSLMLKHHSQVVDTCQGVWMLLAQNLFTLFQCLPQIILGPAWVSGT